LAQSAGVFGVRVKDPADLKEAVTAALQHSGPALVDAVVNRTELSLLRQSSSTRRSALIFGLSKRCSTAAVMK
jgi:thiamine pyrophosphate-dependent acetolactate synthase large subunit-like protein